MTQQRQSFGPGRVLAQVTLIVALPMVGGVVAGLVTDGALGTSPLFALLGLVIGSFVTGFWLRRFIATSVARLRGPSAEARTETEEHEQSTTARN